MNTLKSQKTKKGHIISEASKLFRERGFAGTTMRDLAEKLGIEAASIYNHIRSKDEILEDICFEMAQKYIVQLNETEAQTISVTEKIESVIAFHIQLIIEDANLVSVVNNEWKCLNPEKIREFKTLRNEYEKQLAELIDKGMKQGFLKKMNVSIALFTILSSLRWVELWYKPNRSVTKEDLAKDISAILMNGIKA
jgi:AcrR family transcriptional regulator